MCVEPKVIIALDFKSAAEVFALVERLDPKDCRLKVGKQLFVCEGAPLVKQLIMRGFEVFLDLKFHDIPNTVAAACAAAADMGVWMLNVHAQGGKAMLEAASNALATRINPPLLLAVTVLTSLGDADLKALGYQQNAADLALNLAQLAADSGIDGVVCSAQEALLMRQRFGADFCLVTPGIRPEGSAKTDQQRIVTPQQAIKDGANYLVIGRPITKAEDPVAMLARINAQILPISQNEAGRI